ncbi:MAG TPA: FGGY-family carbohydrate kinase [Nitrososphaerales archaeon]|nr:FGGY-family carbohydrate kinase [Nitrososphaerales archaeon]
MNSRKRILSVDFGTSNCKAILFDQDGRILSSSMEGVKTHFSTTFGSVELDDQELRTSLFSCIRKALSGHDDTEAELVAITAQATSTVCLNQKGNAVRPVISHLDKRADNYGRRLRLQSRDLSYTGLKLGGSLEWIKETQPDDFKATKSICDMREYLGFLLTHRLTHDKSALSESDVSKLCDILRIDESAFGLQHDYLSPIGNVEPNISQELGLNSEVPVLLCPWDGLTCVIGSGLLKLGLAADIAGSTETVAAPVSNQSRLGTRNHLIPNFRLLYDSFPFGLAFEWFKSAYYGGSTIDQFDGIEKDILSIPSTDSSRGPLFVPTLREGWLNWIMGGSLIDLDFRATRGQMMRGIMEGITMSVRHFLDRLREDQIEIQELRVSGGGANSSIWNQIRADILGCPVVLLQTIETGCLGAAIFGVVSLGIYRSIDEGSNQMVHEVDRYQPLRSNVERYEKMYARFTTAYDHFNRKD